MAFALSPERESIVNEVLTHYPEKRAALIPVLWLCQRQHGWISDDVIDFVARRLDESTATVRGVVTFYTLFHQHPVAPHVVSVCRTLSCELRGAKALMDHLEKRFGCANGGTSKDGQFTLRKVECLAACGQAPAVQIDDDYHENLTAERLDQILDELADRAPTRPGSHASGAKH